MDENENGIERGCLDFYDRCGSYLRPDAGGLYNCGLLCPDCLCQIRHISETHGIRVRASEPIFDDD